MKNSSGISKNPTRFLEMPNKGNGISGLYRRQSLISSLRVPFPGKIKVAVQQRPVRFNSKAFPVWGARSFLLLPLLFRPLPEPLLPLALEAFLP